MRSTEMMKRQQKFTQIMTVKKLLAQSGSQKCLVYSLTSPSTVIWNEKTSSLSSTQRSRHGHILSSSYLTEENSQSPGLNLSILKYVECHADQESL